MTGVFKRRNLVSRRMRVTQAWLWRWAEVKAAQGSQSGQGHAPGFMLLNYGLKVRLRFGEVNRPMYVAGGLKKSMAIRPVCIANSGIAIKMFILPK